MKQFTYYELILVILAATIFCLMARWNLYFPGGDSMSYYEIAEWSKRGEAIFKIPTSTTVDSPTLWAPGMPIMIGFLAYLFNTEVLNVYLYSNAILLIINVLLFFKIAKNILDNHQNTFLATLLFLLSYGTLSCHIELSSEPFFMFFYFLGILNWIEFSKSKQIKSLILLGLCFGLATFVRYIGVVLTIPIFIIFLYQQQDFFKRTFIFSLSYAIFPVLIILRSFVFFHQASERIVRFHPFNFQKILQFGKTTTGWFSPLTFFKPLTIIGGALGLVAFTLFLFLVYDYLKINHKKIIFTFFNNTNFSFFSVLVVSYIGFLIFSISFVDAFTEMCTRILYPIYPILLIGMIYILFEKGLNWKIQQSILAITFCTHFTQAVLFVSDTYQNGVENSCILPVYQNDITIAFLKKNYPNIKIYSNIPDVLRINGLGNSVFTPFTFDNCSLLKNEKLEQQVLQIVKEFNEKKAVFVFANRDYRNYYVAYKEIERFITEKPDTLSDKILVVIKK